MPTTKRNPKSVVALLTDVGETLIIRANPTDKAVRGFVAEHMSRLGTLDHANREYRTIYTAKRFASELAYLSGEQPVGEIDLSDLL